MSRKSRTHITEATPLEAASTPAGLAPRHLTKQEFGRRLYALMLEKGWRQSELARRAGIQRDSVSVYVRGRSFPTPLNLSKMAKALGVNPEDLLPNTLETAIRDDEPDFEMKVSPGDTTRAWVRLNRMLTLKTAVQIAALVQADAADGE